ncbi:MAG: amidohydrolase [Bacteroidota bacterium]
MSHLDRTSRAAVLLRIAVLGTFGVLLAACGGPEPADLILHNGRIVTVDSTAPEVEALAVQGDRILAVGTEAEVMALAGPSTQVINLDGRLAIPGLIEGHGHFLGYGQSQMILDLAAATSWDEIVAMVEEAAAEAEPGEWITGRGWHQEKWETVPEGTVDGVPTHHGLSEVSPDNPVLLTHASGHAGFANALAMELGRVSPETADPDGGAIVRDAGGNPTGLLRETAQGLVRRAYNSWRSEMSPEELEAELRQRAALAGASSLAHGVTSFQDAGTPFDEIDLLKQMAEEGTLPVRLYVMVRGESLEDLEAQLPEYRMVGHGNHFLTVRSIKRAVDGALGAHGAWLLEPYEDMPGETGHVVEPLDVIERTAALALANDFQLNVHAIGDRGNREVLDLFERTLPLEGGPSDKRWRIEHAQHLHPDDIPRFGALGVIPAMQAVHSTSDGPWVPVRLGDLRARYGAYMWRELWDTGAVVTNGTDVPVERIDPLASYYATVTRITNTGEAFYPGQALTREEALQSYTINNAYAAFEEDLKGSLTPGKLADIVVLSDDILTIPAEQILDTQVVYTILGGTVAYENPEALAQR